MTGAHHSSQGKDPIWTAIRAEAWSEDEREPYLKRFLAEVILKSRRLEDSLSRILMIAATQN